MKIIHAIRIVFFLCLLSHSYQSEAQIVSVKSMGMGDVGVAYPQDAFAGAFNPAGTVIIGNRVDIEAVYPYSYDWTRISGSTTDGANGRFVSHRDHEIAFPSFGLSGHWCNDCTLAWGIVGYNKNYIQTNYREAFPSYGTSRAGLQLIQEQIATILAFKYLCHHFGISVNYNIQYFSSRGLEVFDDILYTVVPGAVTDRGAAYSGGWSFTVGWIGYLWPDVALGLAYEARSSMTRLDKYSGLLTENGKINYPERITAGLAVQMSCYTNVTAEIQYINWSQVRSLHRQNFTSLTSLVSDRLGTTEGPGFGWTSQTFFRIGVDSQCGPCTVRLGYSYGRSPIKGNQTNLNFLTVQTVHSIISCGCTWDLSCGREVSFFASFGFPNKIHGKRDIDVSLGGGTTDLYSTKAAIGISYGHCW